jgi:hypothetical protein
LVADGEDAGAAVDAAPTETFVMPDAAPYDPNDGNGSVGDGMAPDAVDTGASDPETGPDVSSCDELFGDAEEYFYCEETQTSCTFSARTGGTCADLCASYGAACLRAWDNANDPGADVCASIGDDQCSTRRTTEICKCERISSN